jgi:hypothetical protein
MSSRRAKLLEDAGRGAAGVPHPGGAAVADLSVHRRTDRCTLATGGGSVW